jgi:UDP-2-acetamido-2,6-beta-L-arabino-hexul-4-ose reductase
MRVLITGSSGFVGKHLLYALREHNVVLYDKDNDWDYLHTALRNVDFVYHLAAGIKDGFDKNIELTEFIVDNLECPILFTSSIQTESEYGNNKRLQEDIIRKYDGDKYIYRLSNVFGKWCKPYYNNVVATFIYDIQNNRELTINDPEKEVNLVYIDDVVSEFSRVLFNRPPKSDFYVVEPIFKIKVGDLAVIIRNMKENGRLLNKLYKTYNG